MKKVLDTLTYYFLYCGRVASRLLPTKYRIVHLFVALVVAIVVFVVN